MYPLRQPVLQTKKHENDSPLTLAWEWEAAACCGVGWENSVMQIISQKFIQKKKKKQNSAFNFFLVKVTHLIIEQVTLPFFSFLKE